jgi:hypothetical protein
VVLLTRERYFAPRLALFVLSAAVESVNLGTDRDNPLGMGAAGTRVNLSSWGEA